MSTVDALVTFLRAQLDEDERVARASEAISPAPWHVDDSRVWDAGDPRDLVASSTGINGRGAEMMPEDAAHIACWDPARARAEVEAKRRVLGAYEIALDMVAVSTGTELAGATRLSLRFRREALLAVAQPYADRNGFDPEWRLT